MSEPVIQSISKGCPHCPTRRECACPDGPEKCPDNPHCPCDKTICPCGKHRPPHPEPPGCLTRPLAIGLGAALLVALIVVVIIILAGGGSGDGSPSLANTPTSPAIVTTVPATDPAPPDTVGVTDPPATTSTLPPAPAFDPPKLGPGVVKEVNDLFGGSPVIQEDKCTPATANMQQIDQTGATPLLDPSLGIEAFCLQRVHLDGSQVPMFNGDFLVAVIVHAAPLDPATNIGYQPGIGLDRPGEANQTPADSGEGLLQVEADTLGFGTNLDGWQEAQFFSVPGFGPSDIFGYSFGQPGSRVTGFAIPSDQMPPDTVVFLQSFGRQTAPGATPTNADPAASTLVLAGAAPCVGECPVAGGRFQVNANWASDPATTVGGVESPDGTFWFFSPDNVELVVKVLNGCDTSNSFWVFASGLTDVAFDITVTDTDGSAPKTYSQLAGGFQPVMDTAAFATCP